MPQFGRPSADISVGGWTPTPLWESLDEITADDTTTEITSPSNPANDAFEVQVTGLTDPVNSADHIVRVRVKKSAAAGRQVDFTFLLLQGTTTIASWSAADVTGTYATFTHTLTAGEADAITDYADLRVRVTANATGGGAGRSAQATWIEMEAPDAPVGSIDETVLDGLDLVEAGVFGLDFAADADTLNLAEVVTEDVDSPSTVDEEVFDSLSLDEAGSFAIDFAAEVDSLTQSEELTDSIIEEVEESVSEALSLDLLATEIQDAGEEVGDSLSISTDLDESLDHGEDLGDGIVLSSDSVALGESNEEASEHLVLAPTVETQATVGEIHLTSFLLTPLLEIDSENEVSVTNPITLASALETQIEGGEQTEVGLFFGDFVAAAAQVEESLSESLALSSIDVVDEGAEETLGESLGLTSLVEENQTVGEISGENLDLLASLIDGASVGESFSDSISLAEVLNEDVGESEETVLEALGLAEDGNFSVDFPSEVDSLNLSDLVNETAEDPGAVIDEEVFEQLHLTLDGGLDLEFDTPEEFLSVAEVGELSSTIDEAVGEDLSFTLAGVESIDSAESIAVSVSLASAVTGEFEASEQVSVGLVVHFDLIEDVESPGEFEETLTETLGIAVGHEVDWEVIEELAEILTASALTVEDVVSGGDIYEETLDESLYFAVDGAIEDEVAETISEVLTLQHQTSLSEDLGVVVVENLLLSILSDGLIEGLEPGEPPPPPPSLWETCPPGEAVSWTPCPPGLIVIWTRCCEE